MILHWVPFKVKWKDLSLLQHLHVFVLTFIKIFPPSSTQRLIIVISFLNDYKRTFQYFMFPFSNAPVRRFEFSPAPSQHTSTHLWHLSSSCWSSSCLSRLKPRSGASNLHPDIRERRRPPCQHLHPPGQDLRSLQSLLLQGQWAGRPRALSPESHRGWTAIRLSGSPPGCLGTVYRREGRQRAAHSGPGRTRRNPCRPGTQASGGGRTGPAGTADWLLGPQSEGSSCSPRWGCWDGRSACSCWLADPWGCRDAWHNLDPSLITRRFLLEEFKPSSKSK